MGTLQVSGQNILTVTGSPATATLNENVNFPAGHIVQVKHFDIDDLNVDDHTTEDTWTDLTSNSITTKVDNSHIFIMADIHVYLKAHSASNWNVINFRFLRGTSQIWISHNNDAHGGYTYGRWTSHASEREMNLVNMKYLDTGNTNVAGTTINYDVEFSNRNGYAISMRNDYGKSWVTLMEIVP
tara:strand:+ start:658 stop:1209 length:552 start_codon:yes stop_codon:yes gene_type:complete